MKTRIDEIAKDIYRLSTFVSDANLQFNQFLIEADEPLLFHCGMRGIFPLVSEALATRLDPKRLRWITFGHVEADECGAMNQWLALAPQATVAHGQTGCAVSLNDLADRPPRPLVDREVLDLGGKRVRHIDTPHVPHAWEARVLFEETTQTLLCGDLFTHLGDPPALTSDDIVGPASAAEDAFQATCLTPHTGPTLRMLADLAPRRLALMHGSTFEGDAAAALRALAQDYERRLEAAVAVGAQPLERSS